jgi:hypothetical protein
VRPIECWIAGLAGCVMRRRDKLAQKGQGGLERLEGIARVV